MKITKITILILVLTAVTYPCTIKITPAKRSGVGGEEVKATILIKNLHIPCPLDIKSSEISVSGGTIIYETDWKKNSSVEFEKSITVKLVGPDKATISLKRNCDLKTSQATAIIEVKTDNFYQTDAEVKKTASELLKGLDKLHLMRSFLKTLAQSETDPVKVTYITAVITKLDTAIKYSKNFANKCSLLLK